MLKDVEGFDPVAADPLQEAPGLLFRQRIYLLPGDPRELQPSRGVAQYETVRHGGLQGLVQDDVQLVYRRWREPGVQALPVELTRVGGREVFELDAPLSRLYVWLDRVLAPLVVLLRTVSRTSLSQRSRYSPTVRPWSSIPSARSESALLSFFVASELVLP